MHVYHYDTDAFMRNVIRRVPCVILGACRWCVLSRNTSEEIYEEMMLSHTLKPNNFVYTKQLIYNQQDTHNTQKHQKS